MAVDRRGAVGHRRILGIGTGGSLAKAALFAFDGIEVASRRCPNAVSFPAPGHAEVYPEGLRRAACRAACGALEAGGADLREVVAVSSARQADGLSPLVVLRRLPGIGHLLQIEVRETVQAIVDQLRVYGPVPARAVPDRGAGSAGRVCLRSRRPSTVIEDRVGDGVDRGPGCPGARLGNVSPA